MATTDYIDYYYNGPATLTTGASNMSYTTTTDSTAQQWYYYNPNGNLIQSDGPPTHKHDMPSHNHGYGNGNWTIQSPEAEINHGICVEGEQIVKFNDDVQFKVNGEWVSVEDLSLRIKTLEVITERLYDLLSPWQKEKLEVDRLELEDKKDEFEHFDPDLFKV
jgi:hypothetical protein